MSDLNEVADRAVIESIVNQAMQHLTAPIDHALHALHFDPDDDLGMTHNTLHQVIQKEIAHCLSQYSEWINR